MAAIKSKDVQDNDERYQALSHYLAMRLSMNKFAKVRSELDESQELQLQKVLNNSLKLHKAVLSSSEASQVHLSNSQTSAVFLELVQRFPSRSDFEATLAENKLTEISLKQALQLENLSQKTLEFAAKDIEHFSESDAYHYYQHQADKFKQPERRRASHILITINPEFAENTKEAALKRIQDLLEVAQIHNFADLARRHSECPTAMHGGELGLVEAKTLHPELDAILFKMSPNSLSEVIESEAGFHLLMCQSVEVQHLVPFEQAKPKIIEQHTQLRQKRKQKAWIASLLG
ncbi:peptidylprolyl isomerase [Echinimonas agarilytica]|uniref:peptidylprolyl isomerase n=1 Tax=Echinimonas agarilytica TaxID=1215918 RepID=A0AA42B807_9GAMM|nr:peptidylprolyl isomerase [Echinimonas agarilytica]MCM2680437.1 peptidylprolyl isomerase [Echinimonas agarilytica]